MMRNFNITADNFAWITGASDDPEDLCLHGHVAVTIGGKTFEADGTVSATALYLLKSLKEDHIPSDHDLQMVPCCGHFYIANEDLTEVTILGCDTGLDWTIRHDGSTVLLTAPDGTEEAVPYPDYVCQVCRFADKVERFYGQCSPKILPEDEFHRNGYTAFWNEWYRRYSEAELTGSICKCCGHETLPVPPEEAVAYICPICWWENDVFTADDDEPSDENHGLSLNQGRKNYKKYGICDPRLREPGGRAPENENIPKSTVCDQIIGGSYRSQTIVKPESGESR